MYTKPSQSARWRLPSPRCASVKSDLQQIHDQRRLEGVGKTERGQHPVCQRGAPREEAGTDPQTMELLVSGNREQRFRDQKTDAQSVEFQAHRRISVKRRLQAGKASEGVVLRKEFGGVAIVREEEEEEKSGKETQECKCRKSGKRAMYSSYRRRQYLEKPVRKEAFEEGKRPENPEEEGCSAASKARLLSPAGLAGLGAHQAALRKPKQERQDSGPLGDVRSQRAPGCGTLGGKGLCGERERALRLRGGEQTSRAATGPGARTTAHTLVEANRTTTPLLR
ncbi:hypothetical protein H920_02585 [Fukomys damarensis]|uniref:Uncharacterized protein n=1 Tax=Fukomys damarensis TaxID=885580 RepID=A0A091DY26_FUKDA|nr:hypothetical protein H920_02585 [Fukomys damarensis]